MKYFATKISENLHKTPEGYLLAVGVPIGRVGTMEYAKGETPLEAGEDGIVRVSRDAKELFRPETIASFEGKPLTIRHPEEFVSSENWKELAKGIIQNVRQQDEDLIADILITDQFAISLVENGMRQLSCGYEAEYIQSGAGTGIQKNIVGNHLALVEEGRAGDAYAINDSKGVPRMNKTLAERIKTLFSKTIDEAVAADAFPPEKKKEDKPADKSKDAAAYDELVSICKDLMDKVSKMGQPVDEQKPDDKKPEEKAKDDPGSALEERLKALEAAVSKLLEAKAGDEEKVDDEDEEEEVVEDADGDDDDVVDEDMPKLTGDEKSRIEILAPGLKVTKDAKAEALKQAYKTEDGKRAIDTLTGGKPEFGDAGKVSSLFLAASELLKVARGNDLVRSKKTQDFSSSIFEEKGSITAEKMNEMHAKHYNNRK